MGKFAISLVVTTVVGLLIIHIIAQLFLNKWDAIKNLFDKKKEQIESFIERFNKSCFRTNF